MDHFHKLSDKLRTTEEALSKTSELMAATVDYAKTRPVFDGYKAARYSKKYLAQHEAELATYRAAKDTMNTILNGAKLPKIETLKKSRRELVIYALSDFLIMIVSWLVKQSLRAFLFQEVQP